MTYVLRNKASLWALIDIHVFQLFNLIHIFYMFRKNFGKNFENVKFM